MKHVRSAVLYDSTRYFRNRILALCFGFLLTSSPSWAGLGGVDRGLRAYYIEYLLIVAGIQTTPTLLNSLLDYFAGPQTTTTTQNEVQNTARLLNTLVDEHEDHIADTLVRLEDNFPAPIFLITFNNIRFSVTLNEYRRIRVLVPSLEELLPMITPMPHEPATEIQVGLPSAILYALIQMQRVEDLVEQEFPIAQELTPDETVHAISEHVARFDRLLSRQALLRIVEFILDLCRLNGSNQLFLRENDELFTAIVYLLEDYRRLIVIADKQTSKGLRFKLLCGLVQDSADETLGLEVENLSRFQKQSRALKLIKIETKQLQERWAIQLVKVQELMPSQGLLQARDSLLMVKGFFEKHHELIRELEIERLAFQSMMLPLCEPVCDFELSSALNSLEGLCKTFESTAKAKSKMEDDESQILTTSTQSSSSLKALGEKSKKELGKDKSKEKKERKKGKEKDKKEKK